MRALRIIGGILAAVLGALALLVGATGAVVVGPDDTIELDSRRLTSDGAAVVLPEQLMSYYGPILHVRASAPGEVFLGTAHTTYVQDYLDGVEHSVVHRVTFPFELDVSEESGDAASAVPPTTLHWWEARASGSGEQHLAWKLPDGPYDIVLMRAGGGSGVVLDVRLGIEFPGVFVALVVTALVGAGLLAAVVLIRRRRRWKGEGRDGATAVPGRTRAGAEPFGPPAPPRPGPPPPHGAPPARPAPVGQPPGRPMPPGPMPPRPAPPAPNGTPPRPADAPTGRPTDYRPNRGQR